MSVSEVSDNYKAAMVSFIQCVEVGSGPELSDHERAGAAALHNAGNEVVALKLRSADDVLKAIDLLGFAVTHVAISPRPVAVLAEKVAKAARSLSRDATARQRGAR